MEPISPRVLQPDVPRDLETICLKCLAKEPHKRYASAGALADDLHRFLNREPILARPVGRWERTAKWARRKPWQAAAVALGFALVVGLAVGFVVLAEKNRQVRETNGHLADSLSREETANVELTAAKNTAERERTRAEQTLRLALESLNRYYFAFSDQLKEIPKAEKLRLKVLTQARGTFDDLHKFQADNRDLQRFRMEGYDRLGNIESQLGNLSAAESDYTKARDLAAALAARFPDDVSFKSDRLLMVAKIGTLRLRQGDTKGADAVLDTVVPEMNALVAAEPEHMSVLALESLVRQQMLNREVRFGRWEGVEAEMRALSALHRRFAKLDNANPSRALAVIDSDRQLAVLLLELGKFDAAAEVQAEVLRGVASLPEPLSVAARNLRATVAATLGTYFQYRGLHEPAFVTFAAALRDYETLAAEFSDSPFYRYQQAVTLWSLSLHVAQPLYGLSMLKRAQKLLADLVRDYPDDPAYRERSERLNKLMTPMKPK